MKTTKWPAALSCELAKYEEKHRGFMSTPRLVLYSDGSGRLENMHGCIFEFHTIAEAVEKLKAVNSENPLAKAGGSD